MHQRNIHNSPYEFKALTNASPELLAFVFQNAHKVTTIDFADPEAVLDLNRAILKHHYGLVDWNIPEGYLCPPIPSRVDYIHHIASILEKGAFERPIKGLDIGVGASCIYSILGAQVYDWKMVGSDIDKQAVWAATEHVRSNPHFSEAIEIRHQQDHAHIFKGIIQPDEYFSLPYATPLFMLPKKMRRKPPSANIKN